MTAAPGASESDHRVGLEVHVQLRTASKMFCGNAAAYGAPPNTHVCPVCLGLPGALPVVNAAAVELAVRAALGLHCTVHPESRFARKSYFYPDLPKGYQITQHEAPLATGGYLELGSGRRIGIRRLHLEEDTGKSLHDRFPGATALDLNRAGVPLVEIVTEPELESADEAHDFLVRLKRALEYLEVSDCNLEEGSLRVDANLSLRGPDGEPGPKVEVKNLNSFGNVRRALRFELRRQRRERAAGEPVVSETRFWDAARGETRPLRGKEEAHGYRYFPEPDLPPLRLSAQWIEGSRAALPEMPWARAARLERELGLRRVHAEQLTATRALGDYFEALIAEGAPPGEAVGWVTGEVLAATGEGRAPVSPRRLAELLRMRAEGRLTRAGAKRVFARMLESDEPAARIAAAEGVERVAEGSQVERWAAEALTRHPDEVRRYRAGDARLMDFLIGQVMRASGGRADPAAVRAALHAALRRSA